MIEATIVFRCDLCGAGSKHEHHLDPWQSLEANGLPEGWHFVDTGWGGRKLVCPRHDVFVDKDRTDGDGRGADIVIGGVEPEQPVQVEEQDEPPVAQEEPSNVEEIAEDIQDGRLRAAGRAIRYRTVAYREVIRELEKLLGFDQL